MLQHLLSCAMLPPNNAGGGDMRWRGAIGRKLATRCPAPLSLILLCTACGSGDPPPPRLTYAGLPVSGTLADAQGAGFDDCFNIDWNHMRCRRHGVMLAGQGPYEAAVDLDGRKGERGFEQLTIWHDRDNSALFAVTERLKQMGWKYCYTGSGRKGDQLVLARKDVAVKLSMDLSYWGKRRLRILPKGGGTGKSCEPALG